MSGQFSVWKVSITDVCICISYCFTFYKENNARIKGNWQKETESTVSEYRDECTLSLKKNMIFRKKYLLNNAVT